MIDYDHDERAVSPVVGVAILVGITVILASVVGAFVFGLVDIGEASPDASFTFDRETDFYSADSSTPLNSTDRRMIYVRTVHNSGESIDKDELVVTVSGNQSEPQSNDSVYTVEYNGNGQNDGVQRVWNATPGDSEQFVRPGDGRRITVYGASESAIGSQDIHDYNVTGGSADTGRSPPGPLVGFGAEDVNALPRGQKLGNCDIVEIVWRSPSGDRGQVLQTYRLPGAQCT